MGAPKSPLQTCWVSEFSEDVFGSEKSNHALCFGRQTRIELHEDFWSQQVEHFAFIPWRKCQYCKHNKKCNFHPMSGNRRSCPLFNCRGIRFIGKYTDEHCFIFQQVFYAPVYRILLIIPGRTMIKNGRILIKPASSVAPWAWERLLAASALWTITCKMYSFDKTSATIYFNCRFDSLDMLFGSFAKHSAYDKLDKWSCLRWYLG